MHKIKVAVKWLVVTSLIGLVGLFAAAPAYAISPQVTISDLPDYITTNTFKLSYSSISDDPASTTAQFYYRTESGSYSAFGPLLSGANGQVQVTGDQVKEQVRYYFKVVTSTGVSDETNAVYDISGPSVPESYWKERIAPSTYRIHWKNPNDSDFSRVFIYRGDEPGFSADGSHKVGELGGAVQAEMSWDNTGLENGKEYYYALRAVDKAGNSSSLVGDQGTVVEETTVGSASSSTGETSVNVLPNQGQGQVLGEERTQDDSSTMGTPAPEAGTSGKLEAGKSFLSSTGGKIIVGLGGLVLVFVFYRLLASDNKNN